MDPPVDYRSPEDPVSPHIQSLSRGKTLPRDSDSDSGSDSGSDSDSDENDSDEMTVMFDKVMIKNK